jgi:hypothetical protein
VSKLKKTGTKSAHVLNKPIPFIGDKYPAFSFLHLATNKKYNLDYFKDDHDTKEAAHSLIRKLMELSQYKIVELLSWDKKRGLETIPHSRFRYKALVNGVALHDDTKLYVLRFGQQNYRMICYKPPEAFGLFYIVMLDFDHSAYDHS